MLGAIESCSTIHACTSKLNIKNQSWLLVILI